MRSFEIYWSQAKYFPYNEYVKSNSWYIRAYMPGKTSRSAGLQPSKNLLAKYLLFLMWQTPSVRF